MKHLYIVERWICMCGNVSQLVRGSTPSRLPPERYYKICAPCRNKKDDN